MPFLPSPHTWLWRFDSCTNLAALVRLSVSESYNAWRTQPPQFRCSKKKKVEEVSDAVGWPDRHFSLLLAASCGLLYLSRRTLSFVCLCSLHTMSPTNGEHAHVWTGSPRRYSRWLDKVVRAILKKKKEKKRERTWERSLNCDVRRCHSSTHLADLWVKSARLHDPLLWENLKVPLSCLCFQVHTLILGRLLENVPLSCPAISLPEGSDELSGPLYLPIIRTHVAITYNNKKK